MRMPPANSATEIFVKTYATRDTPVRYQRAPGLKRRSRNSGIVNTRLRRYCGMKIHPRAMRQKLADHS